MTTDDTTSATPRSSDSTLTGALAGGDWPSKAADMVEDVVGAVHDRVVRPLLLAGRVAVFGIIIGAMALVLGVLLAIALVRLLDNYAFGHRVWASEALVGGIITILGLAAWTFRRPRGERDDR